MARILVVDDEEGIRRVLSQLLEYEGHDVRSAGGAAECLEAYPEFRPHLTFLDVKMARMDGLETLKRIRAGGGPSAEAPALMLTALGADPLAVATGSTAVGQGAGPAGQRGLGSGKALPGALQR